MASDHIDLRYMQVQIFASVISQLVGDNLGFLIDKCI